MHLVPMKSTSNTKTMLNHGSGTRLPVYLSCDSFYTIWYTYVFWLILYTTCLASRYPQHAARIYRLASHHSAVRFEEW